MGFLFMRRFLLLSVLFLIPFLAISESTTVLTAPDGTDVTIFRDDFGVPHIYAENEAALFFGQGFAQAGDRLIQLEIYRRRATGRLSELNPLLGANYLNLDVSVRNEYYTKDEYHEMFDAMPVEFRSAVIAFKNGINRYLDSIEANPAKYKYETLEIFEQVGMEVEPWEEHHTLAIMAYFARTFGQAGGNEISNQVELESIGEELFDELYPINDSLVYCTIPDGGDGPKINPGEKRFFGFDSELKDYFDSRKKNEMEMNERIGIPNKFGSFAAVVTREKSVSGTTLLLGCPQMGAPQPDEMASVNEVQLQCPTYKVGGIAITGSPFVIIGRGDNFAWTFTSGISDNTDTYVIEVNETRDKYYHGGEWKDFEVIEDTVFELSFNGITFNTVEHPITVKRTHYGPSFDLQMEDMEFTTRMTFWKNELNMYRSLYELNKLENIDDFDGLVELNSMSFNAFLIDNNGVVSYWHLGHYPDRADGVDPRLLTLGDGSEDWKGIIDASELPHDKNNAQGYYINWNNKPVKWWNNGDNIPWTTQTNIGTIVLDIEEYISKFDKISYEDLRALPVNINDNGTYQQVIEFDSEMALQHENILPPGQSEFADINGNLTPHATDQWPLHIQNEYKGWNYGNLLSSVEQSNLISGNIAYPNPFRNSVSISANIDKFGHVKVQVYDVTGNLVATLFDGLTESGPKVFSWDGTTDDGNFAAPGNYRYVISSGESIINGSVILVR
jgi:penicillin amidase